MKLLYCEEPHIGADRGARDSPSANPRDEHGIVVRTVEEIMELRVDGHNSRDVVKIIWKKRSLLNL